MLSADLSVGISGNADVKHIDLTKIWELTDEQHILFIYFPENTLWL